LKVTIAAPFSFYVEIPLLKLKLKLGISRSGRATKRIRSVVNRRLL